MREGPAADGQVRPERCFNPIAAMNNARPHAGTSDDSPLQLSELLSPDSLRFGIKSNHMANIILTEPVGYKCSTITAV